MVKAIVFDFDGTIIDTEMVWYQAFRDAYRAHGVELTVEMYAPAIGTSHEIFNPFEYLVTDLNLPIDLETFRREVFQRHRDLMARQSMRPGVMQCLNTARAHHLRIGMASSSDRAWVEQYLAQLGIRDYFECLATADDVERVKPDPAVYRRALDCLGVAPEDAVAIEDSPNGARAAKRAGLYCVLIPGPLTRALDFDPVDQRFDSLEAFDLEALIAEGGGPRS